MNIGMISALMIYGKAPSKAPLAADFASAFKDDMKALTYSSADLRALLISFFKFSSFTSYAYSHCLSSEWLL